MRLRAAGGRVVVVAHRGAPGIAPENTLPGIEAAIESGADVVEVDVTTVGGELVLAHSADVARPDSPRLADALAYFAGRAPIETAIQLDVKSRGVEEFVVGGVRAHGLLDRALVTSTFADVLRSVRRVEPSLPTGLAYPYDRAGVAGRGRVPAPLLRGALAAMRLALPLRIVRMARAAEADVVMLHHLVLSARTVRLCGEGGLAVFAWTVNDRTALERVLELGVDGVVTDDPALVLP